MQIKIKGADFSECGLGVVIDEDLKAELISVFGAAAITDARLFAIQKFMSKISWGDPSGIYGKLNFICLPFLCDGTASMAAFYDIVGHRTMKVGYSPVVDENNLSTHFGFDSYGCWPKYNANSSVKATAIGYPLGVLAYKCSEFALMRRRLVTEDSFFISNGDGRDKANGISYQTVIAQKQSGAGYYMQTLTAEQPGLTPTNICAIVHTGIGDYSQDKVFTNIGESFYTSSAGTLNLTGVNNYVKFGGSHSYGSDECKEQFTFSVMGLGVGLNANEARILRDALMSLKSELSL